MLMKKHCKANRKGKIGWIVAYKAWNDRRNTLDILFPSQSQRQWCWWRALREKGPLSAPRVLLCTEWPAPTFHYQRNNFSCFFFRIYYHYGTVRAWGRPQDHGGRGRGPLKFKYHPHFCVFPQNTPPLCCHMLGDALVVFSLFFIIFLTKATVPLICLIIAGTVMSFSHICSHTLFKYCYNIM